MDVQSQRGVFGPFVMEMNRILYTGRWSRVGDNETQILALRLCDRAIVKNLWGYRTGWQDDVVVEEEKMSMDASRQKAEKFGQRPNQGQERSCTSFFGRRIPLYRTNSGHPFV
jgi:hypothetical protein